jgi:hypothetical protein
MVGPLSSLPNLRTIRSNGVAIRIPFRERRSASVKVSVTRSGLRSVKRALNIASTDRLYCYDRHPGGECESRWAELQASTFSLRGQTPAASNSKPLT